MSITATLSLNVTTTAKLSVRVGEIAYLYSNQSLTSKSAANEELIDIIVDILGQHMMCKHCCVLPPKLAINIIIRRSACALRIESGSIQKQ